ncbi:MAG: formyltransferase [Desulfuromonadaceae bacterium]|nr:formyltransferase [Desulfuromonas sp.]MDY0184862.1 formyltransferase [Desulfuromonadaceae bacterium]
MSRCVVFAYNNVGYRCLSVLLNQGVTIPLVVTHQDNPDEEIWFESVADLAARHDIPIITPEDPNVPEVLSRVREADPDFLFSFYYRKMLKKDLLATPRKGALNMHGSLLPRYRGRVPVNWAIIHGEKETGASLHYMELKPDAGALVDQQAVPILQDDTALEVFNKVTVAAELVLHRSLPLLLAGNAPHIPLDLKKGSYFGGRCPEDGRIDWHASTEQIHNLIRAVAPPFPGAFTTCSGQVIRFLQSRIVSQKSRYPDLAPCFYRENDKFYVDCLDGFRLHIISYDFGSSAHAPEISRDAQPVKLGETP